MPTSNTSDHFLLLLPHSNLRMKITVEDMFIIRDALQRMEQTFPENERLYNLSVTLGCIKLEGIDDE